MSKITKKKFFEYERVRVSGVTKMFAVSVVMDISGLSKEECLDIMKNYGEYAKKWKKEFFELESDKITLL